LQRPLHSNCLPFCQLPHTLRLAPLSHAGTKHVLQKMLLIDGLTVATAAAAATGLLKSGFWAGQLCHLLLLLQLELLC
jgi:hypothetical protein